ncbi:unnamed protein product, partial [Ixodes pacificus]
KKKKHSQAADFLVPSSRSAQRRLSAFPHSSIFLQATPRRPAKARTRRRQQVFADDKFWASRRHQRRSEFVCTVGIGRECDARVGSESHLAFGGTSHSRACGCGLGVRCLGVAPSAFPGAQPCRRQPWGEARACAEAIPRPDRHIPIKGIN